MTDERSREVGRTVEVMQAPKAVQDRDGKEDCARQMKVQEKSRRPRMRPAPREDAEEARQTWKGAASHRRCRGRGMTKIMGNVLTTEKHHEDHRTLQETQADAGR